MSEKHYPYVGGSFDRIIFDGDGSVWVPEVENAKLRELVRDVWHLFTEHGAVHPCDLPVVDAVHDRMRELEVEVDE